MDYRNREELAALIESCQGRLRESARQSGIPYPTIQKWAKKHGLTSQPSNVAKSEAVKTGAPLPEHVSIKGLLLSTDEPVTEEYILSKLKMDAAKWRVTAVDVKEYDGYAEGGGERDMYWAQIKIRPRIDKDTIDSLLPKRDLKPGRLSGKVPDTAVWDVVYSDPHFPRDEPTMTKAFLAFCADHSEMIRSVILLGDGMDNSAMKRHRKNRRTDTSFNDSSTPYYQFLSSMVDGIPHARVVMLFGNHEWWLYQRLLEERPELLDIVLPADGSHLITLERILSLDELGIEFMTTDGEYHDTSIDLHPDLTGFHGTKTGKNGGAVTAVSTWESSVFQGHDHKTAMIGRTRRVSKTKRVLRLALSVGASCLADLGYSDTHDVGQSWLIVVDHGGGVWHPEYAIYWPQHDTVTFRDWSFKG